MVVFPTAYFGSIGYFKELVKHDSVLIEAYEHFPKQTYRNRCDILSADGILSLSIPIKKPNGNKTCTKDILLSNDENWRVRHWRSIKTAYQSSPYFDHYGMEIEKLFQEKHLTLIDFNTKITKLILSWLDIEINLGETEEFYPVQEVDHRFELIHKSSFQAISNAPYIQVFPGDENFKESISMLDAVLCLGPMARKLLIP